jgi:hypothetical protein
MDCWEPEAAFKQCATMERDGHVHLNPSYRGRLRFDPHNLAAVALLVQEDAGAVRWFYVRRDGGMAPVMMYDNGPEDFPDGLARSPVGGKIGYIDRNLKLVIPAIYDGAYPFENGIAVVCRDCTLVSGGGHSWYERGVWGCIDRSGNELAPFRPSEKSQPFSGLCATREKR